MSVFEDIVLRLPHWLSAMGEYPEMVISTRVRAARNLRGYQFPYFLDKKKKAEVLNFVFERLSLLPQFEKAHFLRLEDLNETEREILFERRLISRDAFQNPEGVGVVFNEDESFVLIVNEEDHLRFQVIQPGLNIEESFKKLIKLDQIMGSLFEFAFDRYFGFKTFCPTNTGLGIRLSVLIHIPALFFTRKIFELLEKELEGYKLGIRGLYGEGSEIIGNMFQLYTLQNLGLTENELVEHFKEAVSKVINSEKRTRSELNEEIKDVVEDGIWRSKATLENARILTYPELLSFLSFLRLAVGLGKILDIPLKLLNELMFFTQKAHLKKIFHLDGSEREIDRKRAYFIRNKLIS